MRSISIIALIFATAFAAAAQDVTSVASMEIIALGARTTPLTLTASAGDGSVLTLNKIPGPSIFAFVAWTSADGRSLASPIILRTSAAAPVATYLSFGNTACLFVMNPTSAAVTMGSVGPVPASGLGWSCTTQTTAGSFTPLVNGSTVWP